MYELVQTGAQSWFMDCPTRVGFVAADGGVLLIDGGSDRDAAKKALRCAEGLGPVRAVLCTHSHADHIGGCAYLAEHTGVPVYLPDAEVAFGRTPELEGALLFGAHAPAPLRGKLFCAPTFDALPLSAFSLPEGMEARPLPGHSPAMTAFRAPDGVWFLGDAVFGDQTLEKYGLSYLYDVGQTLASFDAAAALEGACFVPAHVGAVTELAALAARNRDRLLAAADAVRALCGPGVAFDELLKGVFLRYGLTMSLGQCALIGSAVKGLLAWLLDRGEITCAPENGRMIWRTETDGSLHHR